MKRFAKKGLSILTVCLLSCILVIAVGCASNKVSKPTNVFSFPRLNKNTQNTTKKAPNNPRTVEEVLAMPRSDVLR